MGLFNDLVHVRIAKIKKSLISSITNLVHELPHKFLNDLRLRILGNWKIIQKRHIWGGDERSAQSSLQKLNFDNNRQETKQLDNKFLKSLPIFLYFFTFAANILSRIV